MTDIDFLKAAVAIDGTRGVAQRVKEAGYKLSHSAISLILSGKYLASSAKTVSKVRAVYGEIENPLVMCPALEFEIHRDSCKKFKEAAISGSAKITTSLFLRVKGHCPNCEVR